ncbi:MAG: hypothetical protein KDH09_13835 [Chrysiogenetes bacterium]|nr:hypothetical protein [Chrysiogenetes bacterium]
MSYTQAFAKAAQAFNSHDWDEANLLFSDLSSQSMHYSENVLCEGFAKLARIYNRVIDTEHYDPSLAHELRFELDRLATELQEELPARVLGISVHGLTDAIEKLEDDLEFARQPTPIRIQAPGKSGDNPSDLEEGDFEA